MNANLKILILLLVFLSSCKKLEWNNPFDSSCPKETWTPTDFKAIQEGTTVKLTWTQPINQISGFKILKGVGGGTATSMQDQSKGAVQLIDNTLTGGKVHLYSLTAYAGNNTSNTVTAQFTPILTAGITTAAISAVTTNTMSSGGNITTDGGAPITARGVCWNTSTLPTITNNKTTDGTGPGTFTSLITGLTPGATYYIRAYAINSIGTSYGNEVTTATAANLPALTTTTVSAVTATTATSGGVISSDGGGTITSRGVCWSTTANPTIANSKTSDATGIGTFTSSITGLTSATTYYVRAYATNSAGTAYGQQEYCVSSYGTASDVDGNTYQTVKIGTQIWTRENLKTTKFKDGTAISLVTDNTAWGALTTPGYCWYNNDATTYKNTYGALYNWNTVGTNKLCPTGWHVPTDVEWTILTNFLGGESIAGGKMKETGTLHWAAPNTGATNETGFTSLQGGFRGTSGTFDYASFGFWWSSSEYSTSSFYSWARQMANNNSNVIRSNATKQYGFSVRCVFGDLTLPTLSTASTASLNTTSASSGGNVSSDGGIEVTARGVCWSTTTAPTIADSKTVDGTGIGSYTSAITGLTAGTTYYLRAYATNAIGTAYGTELSLTYAILPILTTATVSNVTTTAATSGGTISSDGGAAIIARGVCWSTTANPTIANSKTSDATGIGTFASALAGLTSATTYYVRAYATNSAGTAYGQQEYCVSSYGTVSDVDGNTYQTVKIGTQIWTRENLKTTNFKDGTTIPLVTDNTAWGALTAPGFCWYNNDVTTYKNTYGALYNWYAVNTSKLCPTGWHVPTDTEWTILTTYLGGESLGGGKLKETGSIHWLSPNSGATNESGFTSFPGGLRNDSGNFNHLGTNNFLWSYSEYSIISAWNYSMYYLDSGLTKGNNTKPYGIPVRCLYGDLAQPSLTTTAVTSITSTSAASGGNISNDGGTAITARGVCWSTTSLPTIASSKTSDGTGMGSFTSNITGLAAGTIYYVRAYAINSQGAAYGGQEAFTASLVLSLPTVTSTVASTITTTGATLGGNVTADGNAAVSERGVVYSTNQNPTTLNTKVTIGSGTGTFTSNVTGLTAGTTYYVRAYAINSQGTAYGSQETFTASFVLSLPTVSSNVASTITTTGATLGGNVTADGNAAVSERGVVYSSTQNPTTLNTKVTIGSGTGAFTSNVTGLTPGTTYYVRAYAVNGIGTAYGSQSSFTTASVPATTVSDTDGNVYNTVTIGTQVWMASNLKATKYNDGTAIPNITDEVTWDASLSGAYCWYNNDITTNKNTYGALYNFYSVNTGKICPIGWHVPSDSEWTILGTFLGGDGVAGGKLKEVGTLHWMSPNTDATNANGFNALPGGGRGNIENSRYGTLSTAGYWWSSSEVDVNTSWNRSIEYYRGTLNRYINLNRFGASIRCIKD